MRPERLSMKISSDTIGNQTRDFPAQPTGPLRVPIGTYMATEIDVQISYIHINFLERLNAVSGFEFEVHKADKSCT
jgi:hypothetical protein